MSKPQYCFTESEGLRVYSYYASCPERDEEPDSLFFNVDRERRIAQGPFSSETRARNSSNWSLLQEPMMAHGDCSCWWSVYAASGYKLALIGKFCEEWRVYPAGPGSLIRCDDGPSVTYKEDLDTALILFYRDHAPAIIGELPPKAKVRAKPKAVVSPMQPLYDEAINELEQLLKQYNSSMLTGYELMSGAVNIKASVDKLDLTNVYDSKTGLAVQKNGVKEKLLTPFAVMDHALNSWSDGKLSTSGLLLQLQLSEKQKAVLEIVQQLPQPAAMASYLPNLEPEN